jgi:hypothetical protein
MVMESDPVVRLYGERLGNGPSNLKTGNVYPSSKGSDSGSGNAHVDVHNHVTNHVTHEGDTTHYQDVHQSHSDNRSYATHNETHHAPDAAKDHSGDISALQGQVSELGRHVGGIARRQVGMDEDATVNVRTSVVPHVPGNAVPGSVIQGTVHPSVSDTQPVDIEMHPSLSPYQFGGHTPRIAELLG